MSEEKISTAMPCTISINMTDDEVLVQAVFDKAHCHAAINAILSMDGKLITEAERSRMYAFQTMCYLLSNLSIQRGGNYADAVHATAKMMVDACLSAPVQAKRTDNRIIVGV